jgi:hypothetical protein
MNSMDTNPSLIGFIRVVSQLFNISEIEAAFYVGGVTIAGILGIIGEIAFKLGVWNKARGAAYAPMQAFTTKTPFQVVKESQSATVKIFITWVIIIFLGLACGGLYLYISEPGETQTISQTIGNLLRSFLSP